MIRKIILLFFVFGLHVCLAENTQISIQDSIKTDLFLHKADPMTVSIDDRVEVLENKIKFYMLDKELWSHALDRSNTLFTVFNSIILLLTGLGYFGIFRHLNKSVESKIDNKVKDLEEKQFKNELLTYRTMYYNCIANERYDAAILWVSRVIKKETDNPNRADICFSTIEQNVENLKALISKNFGILKALEHKELAEIQNNLEQALLVCGKQINQKAYDAMKQIIEAI